MATKGATAVGATNPDSAAIDQSCLEDGPRLKQGGIGAGVIDSELLLKDVSSDESSDGEHFLPTLFSKKAQQTSDVQNMNEDEQLLLKVEEFNMQ